MVTQNPPQGFLRNSNDSHHHHHHHQRANGFSGLCFHVTPLLWNSGSWIHQGMAGLWSSTVPVPLTRRSRYYVIKMSSRTFQMSHSRLLGHGNTRQHNQSKGATPGANPCDMDVGESDAPWVPAATSDHWGRLWGDMRDLLMFVQGHCELKLL